MPAAFGRSIGITSSLQTEWGLVEIVKAEIIGQPHECIVVSFSGLFSGSSMVAERGVHPLTREKHRSRAISALGYLELCFHAPRNAET